MSGLSSSKCVDDSAFSTADGNKIQMWDCTGGVYQQWTAEPDGTLQVYGKCMDITGANYSNSTNIELWTCNGGTNQQWHLPEADMNTLSGQRPPPTAGHLGDHLKWLPGNRRSEVAVVLNPIRINARSSGQSAITNLAASSPTW